MISKSVRRIISMALVLLMTCSSMLFAKGTDYLGHWAERSIQNWIDKGYVKGYQDGTFKAENDITRAEFMAIVNRSLGFTAEKEVIYKDVRESHWAYNEFKRASAAGYIGGFEDGTLRPNNKITRQEVAAIIARLLNLKDAKGSKTFLNLNDVEKIPKWSEGVVSAIVDKGYMKLRGKDFAPTLPATRAEVIDALNRGYLNYIKIEYNKAGTYTAGVVDGSIEIKVKDVILEDTIINGNLIISEAVGSGNVNLKNVIVKGDTIVRGGGMNSIIIDDSDISNLIIEKIDGKIRILTKGSTYIDNVDMSSGGKLEADGNNFGYIVIAEDISSDEPIILIGNFENIEIRSGDNEIQVQSGTIKNLVIASTAKGAQVNLAVGAKVDEVEINAAAQIDGKGTIGTATVNTEGVKIIEPVEPVKKADGVGKVEIIKPTTSGGGGGGGSITPTKVKASAITVNPTTMDLTVGGASKTIVATVKPADATNKSVTWTSSNIAVATVADGVVTPKTVGTTTITAKTVDGGFAKTILVTVTAAPVTVTGVTIKTPPTKVTYTEGEALDLTGIVVTLTKSDSSTEDVVFADFGSKGITTDKANGAILGVGDIKVTISVNGQTVDQAITVTAAPVTVTGVAIETAPTKVTYTEGEALDLTGLVVTLTKSDSSTEDVVFTDFGSKGITTDKANGTVLGIGDTKVTISVNGQTVDQAITVTAAPVTVTGVAIETAPTKVTYTEGEALDLTGLVVTLTKSDSSTEDVAFADFGSKGITTDKANGAILGVGDTKVTISVNGQTVDQAITVTAAPVTVTGVAIETAPTKVTYTEGEALDLTGIVVTLTKSDSSTEDVVFADFGSKGITTDKANGAILGVGDIKVTISVNGQTVDQAITVTAAPVTVTGVAIETAPTKVTYTEGEALDLTGLVVTLTKSDSSTEDVVFTDFGSKGITTDKANGTVLGIGDTKVTISVNGQTVDQAITVTAAPVTVTGVAIETAPTKVTYTEGEALDLTGIVVTLTKSDSSTEDVVFADFGSKGITTDKANGAILGVGDIKVTISVNGQTVDQAITVTAAPVTVTGVAIETAPTKVTYTEGEALDLTGLVVTLTKSDSSTEDVAFADFGSKGITTDKANGAILGVGDTKVTISVNGQTVDQAITVTAAPVTVTGVTIETPPMKVTYTEGDALDLTGLVVTLAKSDSSTEDVAFADFGSKGITTDKANGAILGVGDTKVTISVNGQTVDQAITVTAAPPAYLSTNTLANPTVTVVNGTSEVDAIAALDKTVEVVGTNSETGTATIAWTIASYNGSTAGDYTATGVLTLPTGWTGTAGNVTATVTVEAPADTIPPVITLLGNATVNIANGASYTDAGATALDDVDGDITSEIVVGGDTVNTSTAGTYVITYNVSDAAGNAAVEVKRTVVVAASSDEKITLAEIPGVTAPVTGAIPDVKAINTEQYTGTIVWTLGDETFDTPFAAGKAYKATITLTAKSGYILAGVTENFFTVAGATTTTNAENDGVVTAVFSTTGTVANNIKILGTDNTEYTLNNLPKGLSWDGSILTMNNFKGKYIHQNTLKEITINVVGDANKLTAGSKEALLFNSGITIQGTGKLTLESKHPKDSVGGNMTIQEGAIVTINIDKSTERAVSGNVTVKGTGKLEVNTVGKNTVRSSVRVANRIYLEDSGNIKVNLTNEISTESDARIASDIPYIHGKAVVENYKHLYYEKSAYKVVGEWSALRGGSPHGLDPIKLTYTVPNSVDKLYTSGGDVNSDAYMKMIQQDSIVSSVTMYNNTAFTTEVTDIELYDHTANTIYVKAEIDEDGSTQTKYYIITIIRDKAGVAEILADKAALTADSIKGENTDLDNIIVALKDPLPSTGAKGSTITWQSNKPEVVSNDGQIVKRPNVGNETVTLTATLTKGTLTQTKDFVLTVLELESSTIVFADPGPITKTFGGPVFTNDVTDDGAGVITYSSENTEVATVDSSSGEVTIVGVGTTVITASKAATSSHAEVTETYTLTVNAKAIEAITPIIGTAKVGEILTTGSVTPSEASLNYQWLICDTADGIYANIEEATNKTYTILAENANKFIKVAVTGTGNYSETVTSDATVAVANAEKAAPTGLAGVAPTSAANNDGKITGTTAGMEYKSPSESDWTPATGTEITGLAAGEYLVRYAAKTGYNASPETTVTVSVTKYTVTYDANTGTGTAPTQEALVEGGTFTVADTTGLTAPEGKQFKEWNTSADGTGTPYAVGSTFTVGTENVTLYAIWEEAPSAAPDPDHLSFSAATNKFTVAAEAPTGTYKICFNDSDTADTTTVSHITGTESVSGEVATAVEAGQKIYYTFTETDKEESVKTADGAVVATLGAPSIVLGHDFKENTNNGYTYRNYMHPQVDRLDGDNTVENIIQSGIITAYRDADCTIRINTETITSNAFNNLNIGTISGDFDEITIYITQTDVNGNESGVTNITYRNGN